MDIVIDINKSVEQNAEVYFERAKKLKKKMPGIKKTIELTKHKLELLNSKDTLLTRQSTRSIIKKEWYEKFRWFYSSDDYLVIGGRDATTNEIIIKKHMENNDIVCHTELPGSPFVIIKNPDNKQVPESTINEAAEFCASFSKSWKSGRTTAEVYYITPEQVSKEVPAGLSKPGKGSFMIYGKRNYLTPKINIAICNHGGRIMVGPISAISKHEKSYIEIIPGNDKLSDVAKKVMKIISGDLDTIIRSLPSECAVKKIKS